MKIKSIQQKIALSAAMSILVLVGIIVAFFTYEMNLTAAENRELAEKQGVKDVAEEGEKIAREIETKLDQSLYLARSLAQMLSGVKDPDRPLKMYRDEFTIILKTMLENNPQLLGIYTAWEPDAFDGLDDLYMGVEGHDQTGRYIPYWHKGDDGEPVLEALVDYDKEGAGDYYQIPKKTMKECILEPYIYEIGGKPVLLTSMVAPIIVNDVFYGIAGVDMKLDSFQAMADNMNQFFDGHGRVVLISNSGILAGVTGKPGLVGKHMQEVHNDWKADIGHVQSGKQKIEVEEGNIEGFIPIRIGQTGTPWSANVLVPESIVTAQAVAKAAKDRKLIIIAATVSAFLMVVCLILMWWVAGRIAKPIKKASALMDRISIGDLSAKAHIQGRDEVAAMGASIDRFVDGMRAFLGLLEEVANGDLTVSFPQRDEQDDISPVAQKMVDSLHALASEVNNASEQVHAGAGQISSASQSLSQGATEQAASLQEITASMSEIAKQAKENAENAREANNIAHSVGESGDKGASQMEEMVASMGGIEQASNDISKIIKVIDDIAFQTNLLALNAAVEAARAGKHGKGFAVVAQEVRNLASRSAKAAAETSELIEDSIRRVTDGSRVASETEEILREVLDGIHKVTNLAGEIAEASNDQAQGAAQINQALGQIDSVTQLNTANAEETASSAQELSAQASTLKSLIGRFKTNSQRHSGDRALISANDSRSMPEFPMLDAPDDAWG
ncbi:Methyl-accepting chemotaxis sensory transducer [Desulfatibacillum aliphaticivorans]|uniref:Methyl-accepting chemotaxis sensory transducer n=1 Tax=Desulfatibacillum aliphaticivorans TaxID=218208 RepID=B8FHR7_DESAL|nr:methyl-accepting chemotaxis protein [Desulfatibacillum aliphaticivorans]ACL02484.1 Methyl-accepting chemotaxis sensory transducer [Desulfatibacillum aliphaticivorans]